MGGIEARTTGCQPEAAGFVAFTTTPVAATLDGMEPVIGSRCHRSGSARMDP
jgi:hypothetical protein